MSGGMFGGNCLADPSERIVREKIVQESWLTYRHTDSFLTGYTDLTRDCYRAFYSDWHIGHLSAANLHMTDRNPVAGCQYFLQGVKLPSQFFVGMLVSLVNCCSCVYC